MGIDAPGRISVQILAEGDGLDLCVFLQQSVQRLKKRLSILAVGAAGVLAEQHNRQDPISLPRELPGEPFFNGAQEVACRLLVVSVVAVVEADGIRESCVPEEDADGILALLGAIQLTQDVRLLHLVAPAARARQHPLIGGESLNLPGGTEREGELANGPLSRPHTPWHRSLDPCLPIGRME